MVESEMFVGGTVPAPRSNWVRILDMKRRSSREASILHLIGAVLTVSVTIYLWHLSCLASDWLCPGSSADCVLVLPNNSASEIGLQRDDFRRLIDLEDFSFLMNNYVACNDSDPLLLVLVHSHPGNFLKRATIRGTWGSIVGKRFKLLFLVGIPADKYQQRSLERENKANEDLIQGSFVDAYRNMTYKHVMALKWATYFCPNGKYVLKTDDDVFVNSPAFLDYITKNLLPYSVKRLLFCSPVFNSRVKRSSRSKWKVTFPEYKYSYYPTYCEGFAILYSPDVVFTLYAEAQAADYFWIDDVHVTGLLAAKAKLKHSPFGSFLLPKRHFRKFLNDETGNSSYLVGPFDLPEEDIAKLWEKVVYSIPGAAELTDNDA